MDLYRAPWFPFFQDDFVSGTGDLETEEIGAYILLLSYAWNKGGIPTAIPRLATIAKLSVPRMRSAWAALSSKFTAQSRYDSNLLTNRRLEIIRDEMCRRAEARRLRGQKGASARWTADAPSISQASSKHGSRTLQAVPETVLGDANSNSVVLDPINSATAGSDNISRATPNDAIIFGEWFLARGIELGVIPPHKATDDSKGGSKGWAYRQEDCSANLLASYGRGECEKRAERLFQARIAGKVRRQLNVAALADLWDWSEISGIVPNAPAPRANERGAAMDAQIEEQQRKRTEAILARNQA